MPTHCRRPSTKRLLDLGAGPESTLDIAAMGIRVTGVDIRAFHQVARESARQKNLAIEYCRKDAASGLGGNYDLITLIYCDFGVLARTRG